MDSPEGVHQFVERLVEVTDNIKTDMASSGRHVDTKTIMKVVNMRVEAAERRIEAQEQRAFQLQLEYHRCSFEHGQRTLDRERNDRHHKERIDVEREAKGWHSELVAAREKCYHVMATAVTWSALASTCFPVVIRAYLRRAAFGDGVRGFLAFTWNEVCTLLRCCTMLSFRLT
jgi:hypothetical protein